MIFSIESFISMSEMPRSGIVSILRVLIHAIFISMLFFGTDRCSDSKRWYIFIGRFHAVTYVDESNYGGLWNADC